MTYQYDGRTQPARDTPGFSRVFFRTSYFRVTHARRHTSCFIVVTKSMEHGEYDSNGHVSCYVLYSNLIPAKV